MASDYTPGYARGTRSRLAIIRNMITGTRTGLELGTPAAELLVDLDQAIRELTTIRDQLRRMVEHSPDRAFTLPGGRP